MKALKIIGIVILVLIVAVVMAIMVMPSETHVERSVVVNKDVPSVYANIIEIKNFNNWSPWAKIDPDGTTYSYEGPESGIGAKMSWASEHKDVGNGAMWIVEVDENKKISMRMDFGMGGEPYAHYILEDTVGGAKVTWTYDQADLSGMGKLFGPMMDGMLGPAYEEGLTNFKTYIEGLPDTEPVEEVMESDSTMVESDSTVME